MTVAGVGLRERMEASWKEGCLTGCPSFRRGDGKHPKSFPFFSCLRKRSGVFFFFSVVVFFCLWGEVVERKIEYLLKFILW